MRLVFPTNILPLLILSSSIAPLASAAASSSSGDKHQQPIHIHSPYNPSSMENWQADTPKGPPLLGDVIPLDRSISIFSSLTRSVPTIQTRISDASENTTVLAPANAAISRLPRKPWEDPDDQGAGGNVFSEIYKGLGGEDRAGRNLRRFVEMHCVGASPWEKGVKVNTLGGGEIWWDEDKEGGGRKIYPDGIPVKRVQGEVENGALWIIDGVINYPESDEKKK